MTWTGSSGRPKAQGLKPANAEANQAGSAQPTTTDRALASTGQRNPPATQSGDHSQQESTADLPQLVPPYPMPFRRTIRRAELRQVVPLSDTTIYEMERRGEFPRRFNLTARCVVWDLAEVEAWVDARRKVANGAQFKRAPAPDVKRRKRRPVKAGLGL